jgi:BirA family biotin operon repressor/biotin-[acetyl-CoA-carboxylase] ligase
MRLEIPSVFEPLLLEEVDCVLREALERARSGAPEGTLLWAKRQRAATTRRGERWLAPAGNLHCAVIFEPDMPLREAQQLVLVGALAAGAAVAEVVTPMTGLGFGWPGDLYLNELLAGQVQMAADTGSGEHCARLALGLSVNVAWHPPNPEPERFNSVHASGEGDTDAVEPVELLQLYARHLLRWLSIWQDSGFDAVRDAWRARAHLLVAPGRLQDAFPEQPDARAWALNASGDLGLDDTRDMTRHLTIAEYFAAGGPSAPSATGR